ncbi:hypothetical protein C1S99_25260 [Vibrio parahaemolyticus]|uniref:hypothetical protein n=1 Tax=Vibrio TaxID=662 RepID=UPI00084B81DF|nr:MULTISPECIES: hypothetical protein [Vibrio]EGR0148899.1 hypothetical protein [Vibrio alginolyticus]EGQ8181479.1 hypothetical protein [Vibrio parahaemolyticus]EGR3375841.1 hypothetical protein [Vibrio parahaemolyticus]EHD6031854.1 hypothetical protein [Vibrio parahaemolyticus]EHR6179906.1 hypothetical protein [Vibrio parahaemolyticus]
MEFTLKCENMNPFRGLIYEWKVTNGTDEIIGVYVGKASNGISRPLKDYKRNVAKIIAKKPYRKSNPDGFRKVHLALHTAVVNKHSIELTILENVTEGQCINSLEQQYISKAREKHGKFCLNG